MNRYRGFHPFGLVALAIVTAGLAACSFDDSALEETLDAITIDGSDDAGAPDTPIPDAGEDADADAASDVEPADTGEDAADADDANDASTDPVPVDTGGPPPRCELDAECDDGLACTADECVDGVCAWTLTGDTCLVNGVCVDAGDASRDDPCAQCVPASDAFAWTTADAGTPCDTGDACLVDPVCDVAGACVGDAVACEDGNPCTANACDPILGCVFEPVDDGLACDDGDPCTSDDVCIAGACGGETVTCDDGNPCTDDACLDDGACANTPNTDPCDDGDACTDGDTCADGACVPDGPTNCDDGNACTIDLCDEFVGCSYLPDRNPCCSGIVSVCDDGDPCTTDLCDPDTAECAYELNTARCDDGDACTDGDTCAAGECVGEEVTCPADDPCAAAFCDADDGCGVELLSGVPCDDGIACTIDDACVAGVCTAGVSECVCEPTFGEAAVKVTALRIGDGGVPGEALDLDADPDTCAPDPGCSGGVHNALTIISTFANDSLADAIADGSLVVVLDIDSLSLNPFGVTLYQGELDPENPECDLTAASCDYRVSPDTLDPDTCEPLVRLSATRSGDRVVAGGPGTILSLDVPLGDAVLGLTLYDVRLEGTLVVEDGAVTSFDGILGGAVLKSDLRAALAALPADALPFPPDTIAGLLDTLVVDDIDIDGDGEPDASSIGLPVAGIGGRITGVTD